MHGKKKQKKTQMNNTMNGKKMYFFPGGRELWEPVLPVTENFILFKKKKK